MTHLPRATQPRAEPAPNALRLFVALTPPPDARASLAAAARPLVEACGGAARAVAPELVHLTLRFLGATAPERVAALRAELAGAAATVAGPLTLVPAGAGAFPAPARAQVLWVGLAPDAALAALAAGVDAACAAAGFGRDARPFRAHVTVARVRRGARVDGAALGAALGAVQAPRPFSVHAVELVASTLTPTGPRYEPVARLPLGGAAA